MGVGLVAAGSTWTLLAWAQLSRSVWITLVLSVAGFLLAGAVTARFIFRHG
jgi:hypothetical protein